MLAAETQPCIYNLCVLTDLSSYMQCLFQKSSYLKVHLAAFSRAFIHISWSSSADGVCSVVGTPHLCHVKANKDREVSLKAPDKKLVRGRRVKISV